MGTRTYMQESHENYDEFMKALGSPAEMIEMFRDFKVKTEMEQGTVFRISKVLPTRTWTNTFTVGEDWELEDISGTKFRTTVTMDGGKLQINFPKYTYIAETEGDKLIEVSTVSGGGPTWKKISKRV